jgi:hypothetical protein
VGALALAASLACVAGVASTGLTNARYSGGVLNRVSLASVRDADDDTREVERFAAGAGRPKATLVAVFGAREYGPNVRSLVADLPEARIAELLPEEPQGLLRAFRYRRSWLDRAERKEISPEITRIVWLDAPDADTPSWLLGSLPGSRRVYAGRTVTVFVSDVGDAAFDVRIPRGAQTFHLARFPPSMTRDLLDVASGEARFGDGWYGIDTNLPDMAAPLRTARGAVLRGWRWMGETGEIDVLPWSATSGVHLRIEGLMPTNALPEPPVLRITLDGTLVDSFPAPMGPIVKDYDLAVPVVAGKEMRLAIATSATIMVPGDPRRLGFALTTLSWWSDGP